MIILHPATLAILLEELEKELCLNMPEAL